MSRKPLVSIVIPHLKGEEILKECLQSLERTNYPEMEVIVVDNGSTDASIAYVQDIFPWIKVVENSKNLGYAGGCNAGVAESRGKYVLFLNDDTVTLDSNWLDKLVDTCENNPKVAACQPKLLSLVNRDEFDYAGAAGGLMDVFGFPFALGRIFFTIEKDQHQYDQASNIFWASGTAMFVKKSILEQVGNFDEDFFAHMEEIDLSWRIHLTGQDVVSVPDAVVYHKAGSTLRTESYLKVYLNHRNGLVMLLKNYEWKNLLWIFPLRLLFEFVAVIYSLIKLDFVRIRAVFVALGYVGFHLNKILAKRRRVQKNRKLSDAQIFSKFYRGSIVFDYFVKGRRSCTELLGLTLVKPR
ncbi:glycosyltransferase family 2 protein [candidate division KSB1 bacterium]|nr:glycosyltransferase family 2 protein [candidate division KSB1 bacterium]NIR72807.1 glycosyltransferase family 2 protein [candidate division KSB1 bacterium]NIS26847.1 glycosyltransferase family 2 protein [candidate division KSB1 bacterium]NIT73643.1 glycosyltransferase family 2 protein [candidate division KSB1 bacterium]NIU27514.1 glycosyltransferase family 2 protein [candidate division KSB1 bacterium]